MKIKIAYANSMEDQQSLVLDVSVGTTVKEALELAYTNGLDFGLRGNDGESIDINDLSIGIFSQKVSFDHVLSEHDRIEIYRPLIIDPMTKRRLRANKNKRKK